VNKIQIELTKVQIEKLLKDGKLEIWYFGNEGFSDVELCIYQKGEK
jgi:hypothetical protein